MTVSAKGSKASLRRCVRLECKRLWINKKSQQVRLGMEGHVPISCNGTILKRMKISSSSNRGTAYLNLRWATASKASTKTQKQQIHSTQTKQPAMPTLSQSAKSITVFKTHQPMLMWKITSHQMLPFLSFRAANQVDLTSFKRLIWQDTPLERLGSHLWLSSSKHGERL